MTTEPKSPIIRTTGGRIAKGVAIIIIVMVVGAAISLAFQDVWYGFPPLRTLTQKQPEVEESRVPVGEKLTFNFVFKESDDLSQLWFEVEGYDTKNPQIEVNLGDEITININNAGLMPHAFGVVTNPDDVNSIVFNSAIGSASKPLLSGATGSVTFKATKPGEYHYICLVPGHATQGMMGKFIVREASEATNIQEQGSRTQESSKPTQEPVITLENNAVIEMAFKESDDLIQLWFIANGEKNPTIRVKSGTQITINIVNEGLMPHAFGVVTNPDDVNSIVFNSAIGSASKPLLSNKEGSVTFIADKPGEYHYICLVPGHATQGMMGKFIVE